ncbi:MAG: CAF17-like 4Fe-4S cluster assembly/insertion protein YgfZ [Alphaproteobacteria bacterium]
MDKASWSRLPGRGVVAVDGAEARHFLQNLITNDVDGLDPGNACYAALLSPQGKILFDFIVFAIGDGFLLDVPRHAASDLVARLALYRLKADVQIVDRTEDLEVQAAWGMKNPPRRFVPDPRLPDLGFRQIVPSGSKPDEAGAETDANAYATHRIALSVPEGDSDYAYGDAFPHDANIDQLRGVDFSKGCFVGQEVVARMRHRGTARRRIVQVRGASLSKGAEITDGDMPIGTVGSTSDDIGIAMVRIDRAAQAIAARRKFIASGNAIEIQAPAWANFELSDPVES